MNVRKVIAKSDSATWLATSFKKPVDGFVHAKSSDHLDLVGLQYTAEFNDRVLMIKETKVGRGSTKTKLPVPTIRFLPSQRKVADTYYDRITKFTVVTVNRCAPWTQVLLGPRLLCSHTGHTVDGKKFVSHDEKEFGGVAQTSEGKAWVSIAYEIGYSEFTNILHHEIWHTIENTLSDEMNAEIQGYLGKVAIIDKIGTDYQRAPKERLARAYAQYACMCDDLADQGFPIPMVIESSFKPLFDIFACVYSGEYANALRAKGDLVGCDLN